MTNLDEPSLARLPMRTTVVERVWSFLREWIARLASPKIPQKPQGPPRAFRRVETRSERTPASVAAHTPLPPRIEEDDRPSSEMRPIPRMPEPPDEESLSAQSPSAAGGAASGRSAHPSAPPPSQSLYPSGMNHTTEESGPHLIPPESLVEDLFDALHQLNFKESLQEGAEFILDVAHHMIPSRAGVVHLYDINHAQYVVVASRGPRSGPVLGTRASQADELISHSMRKQDVLQLSIDELKERSSRVATLTPLRTVVVAPCHQPGQEVGAIELYDSTLGEDFSEAEEKAVAYLAETFTRFVSERGLLIANDEPPSAQSA